MPKPGEHKTVQARILAYAEAIGWKFVSREEAEQRRGFDPDVPPADPAREEYQITRLRHLAQDAHLDPDFAEKFLNFIIKEVIRHHEAIAAEHGGTEKTA